MTADEPNATEPGEAELHRRRSYLQSSNGIRGLEVLEAAEVERAVRIFQRDGFVVVRDALDPDQLARIRTEAEEAMDAIIALDPHRSGNRGSHRYSFGGSSITRSMLHLPAWQMLVDLPTVTPFVTVIFGSAAYMLRAASGDFCLPGATEYQPLHSDMRDFVDPRKTPFSSFSDPRGHLSTRDLPCPYLCVNVLTVDSTPLNGPTRQIPALSIRERPFPPWTKNPSGCGSARCALHLPARCRSATARVARRYAQPVRPQAGDPERRVLCAVVP